MPVMFVLTMVSGEQLTSIPEEKGAVNNRTDCAITMGDSKLFLSTAADTAAQCGDSPQTCHWSRTLWQTRARRVNTLMSHSLHS